MKDRALLRTAADCVYMKAVKSSTEEKGPRVRKAAAYVKTYLISFTLLMKSLGLNSVYVAKR